jgi:transcriptional adapter 3
MSSSLVQYTRRSLFALKNAPDTITPTEELKSLRTELVELRQHTLERAKKADDDLRTIEESIKRLKEY